MKRLTYLFLMLLAMVGWSSGVKAEVILDQSFVTAEQTTTLPDGWTGHRWRSTGDTGLKLTTNGCCVTANQWQWQSLDHSVTITSENRYKISVSTYATSANNNTVFFLSSDSYSVAIGNSYNNDTRLKVGQFSSDASTGFVSFQDGTGSNPTSVTNAAYTVSGSYEYVITINGTAMNVKVGSETINYTLPETYSFDKVGICLDGANNNIGVKSIKVETITGDEPTEERFIDGAIAGIENLAAGTLSINDDGRSTITSNNGTITINNTTGVSAFSPNDTSRPVTTVSFRINLSTPTQFTRIFTLSSSANVVESANIGIGISTENKLEGTWDGNEWNTLKTNAISAGSHVITVAVGQSDNSYGTRIYVDGKTTYWSATGLKTSNKTYNNVIFDPAYSAAIDAVYIFNSALSANDIATVTSEISEIPSPNAYTVTVKDNGAGDAAKALIGSRQYASGEKVNSIAEGVRAVAVTGYIYKVEIDDEERTVTVNYQALTEGTILRLQSNTTKKYLSSDLSTALLMTDPAEMSKTLWVYTAQGLKSVGSGKYLNCYDKTADATNHPAEVAPNPHHAGTYTLKSNNGYSYNQNGTTIDRGSSYNNASGYAWLVEPIEGELYQVKIEGAPSTITPQLTANGMVLGSGASFVSATPITAENLSTVVTAFTDVPNYDKQLTISGNTIKLKYSIAASLLYTTADNWAAQQQINWLRLTNCSNANYVMYATDSKMGTKQLNVSDADQLIAFVGDANGFKIVSRHNGTSKELTASGTDNGTAAVWTNAGSGSTWYLDDKYIAAAAQPGYGITTIAPNGGADRSSLNMYQGNGGDCKFFTNGTNNGGSRWTIEPIQQEITFNVSKRGEAGANNTKIGSVQLTYGNKNSTFSYDTNSTFGSQMVYLPVGVDVTVGGGYTFRGWTRTISGDQTQGFTVSYEADDDKSRYLWYTEDGKSFRYRIPALGIAKNGNIIAINDRRYTTGDVGNGRVDQVIRISEDNGDTWTPVDGDDGNLIIRGTGNMAGKDPAAGFGDPALVVDRESGKALLLTVCGYVFYGSNAANTYPRTAETNNRVARFYSTDGGRTWGDNIDGNHSEPAAGALCSWSEITKDIYDMLDVEGNTLSSLFVGSGKIFQSRVTKVGNYYRIYAALCCKPNGNRVIYSDDFGQTWNVLGGALAKPAPDGDEPKCEELPNGDVILSSRKAGGRYFNIYSFITAPTPENKVGEGAWGSQYDSRSATGGISNESGACNGEILIVKAKKAGDDKVYTVAMQSLPRKSRESVEIWWKDITDPSSYQVDGANSVPTFAANWNRGLFVSGMNGHTTDAGAYSTMIDQKDGRIGFFYEDAPGNNSGYQMTYVPLTISEITEGAYETIVQDCTPQLQAAITAAEPLLEETTKVGYRKDVNGTLKAAVDAAKAKIESGEEVTMEDVAALTSAAATYEASTEVNMPQAGHLYRISYIFANGTKLAVYRDDANNQFKLSNTKTATLLRFDENGSGWTLMAPEADGKCVGFGEKQLTITDNLNSHLRLKKPTSNYVRGQLIATYYDNNGYKTMQAKSDKSFDQYSNKNEFKDDYTNDISTRVVIEEVTDYYNVSVVSPEGTNFRALTTGGAYAYDGGYLVFDEVPTEGNFENEHDADEVDMAVTVTDNVIQVSYEAKPKYFTNNAEKLLSTIGHPINTQYTALKEAYEAYMHAASDAGLDALKEAIAAYEGTLAGTTSVATSVVLPSGYYHVKSVLRRGYLYNDYLLDANKTNYTLMSNNENEAPAHNNGIWKVTNNNDGTITIVNGQGTALYAPSGTALNTLNFGVYNGSNKGTYFTQNINTANNQMKFTLNGTSYYHVGTWDNGNCNDNNWYFEPVEGDFWTVKIMGGEYVKSADQTEYVRNGGFIALAHTPTAEDFTMQEFTEEGVEMSVFANTEEKVVTISYGKTKFDPTNEVHRAVWREVNQALAKTGLGYPRCNIVAGQRDIEKGSEARTNLFNATKLIDIAYAAGSKEENETALYLETFEALLDAYYTDSDVEMPQEGHVYAFEAHFFDKTNGIALDDNANSLYITDTNESFNANLVKWKGEDNGMKMTHSKETGYLQNGAYWMAHKDANGKYYFVSAIGNKMGDKSLHTSLTENQVFYLCQSAAFNNKTTGYATFGDFSLRLNNNTGNFMGTRKSGQMVTWSADNQNGANETYAWRLVEADMNYVYTVNVNSDKPSSCPTIQPQVIVTLTGNLQGFDFTEKASGYGFFVLDADILDGEVSWSANDILNGDAKDPYTRLIAGAVTVNRTNKTIDAPYTFDYETVLPKLYAATDDMLKQTGFGYPKVGVNEEGEADVTKDWRTETTVRHDLNTVLVAQKDYVVAENFTDKAAAADCYNALMTAQANYYGNMTDADIIIPANGVPVLLVNEFRNEALSTTYRNYAYDKKNDNETLSLTLAMPDTRTEAEGKGSDANILPASVEDPLLFARYIWTIQRDNEQYITEINETSNETAYTAADRLTRTQSGAVSITEAAATQAGYTRPEGEVTPTVSEDGLTSTYVYNVMVQGADGTLNRVNSNTSTSYRNGIDDLEKSMSTIVGSYQKRAEYDQVSIRETRTVVKTQKTTTISKEVDVIGEDGLPTGEKQTVSVVAPVYSYNGREVTEATHQEGEGDEAHDVPNEPVYNEAETCVYEQITEHVVEKIANVEVNRNFPTYYISATVGDGYIGRASVQSATALLTTDHNLQFNVAFVKGTRIGTVGMLFVFASDPEKPRYISGDLKGSKFDRYNFQTGYDTEHATQFGGIWSTDWNFVNVTTVNTHKEGDQLMVGDEYVKVDDDGKGELSPVAPDQDHKVETTKDILSWEAPIFEGYPVKFAASDTKPVDVATPADQDTQYSYATLKLPYAVYLPVGVTQHVYTLKAVHHGSVATRKQLELTDVIDQLKVTLGGKECIILPRETPVLIEHNALDKYYLSPALALQSLATQEQLERLDAAVAGNLFKGTLGRQKVSEIASDPFVLAKKKARAVVEVDGSPTFGKEFNTVAFYRYTGQYMPANKAFVDWSEVEITDAPASVRAQNWMIDDEEEQYVETSVGDLLLEVDTETGAVYDITGRKFDRAPRQGVYIQKGKKYIAK